MPIDSSAQTVDTPESQQEAASLLQRAQNGARRLRSPMTEVDAALSQASTVANAAYTSLWDRGQDMLEQFTLGFFVAPIVSFVYLLRLFIGTFQNGGFTISYRTFMLKAVPGLKIYDVRRHVTAIAFIFLFLIQISIAIIFIRAASDTTIMQKMQLCAIFNESCK